jgi:hypothetical protein
MTATHVMGLKVVDTFKVPTGSNQKPFGKDNGVPAHYRQIVGLILENGHRLYGCLHCEYVHEKVASVRPHLNAHGVKGDGQTPKAQRLAAAAAAGRGEVQLTEVPALSYADIRSMSLEEIFRLVNRARRVVDDSKDKTDWKARALKAEGDLDTLRALIKEVSEAGG